ncbi:MAG: trypsin-like peptidase domain-containing protein [Bacteroidales bacterium]|nr:trypsin-like peptidase domain-containing protein [Bacteroidales bacterium]
MKKIVSYLLIGITGGLIGASVFFIAGNNQKPTEIPQTRIEEQASALPAHYASMSSANSAQLFPDFTGAAELTVNAVVHIRTEYTRKSSVYDHFFFDFHDFFGDRPQRSNPQSRPIVASGSGVIISGDGFIVTNNHVVQEAELIEVTLNDRSTFEARVIGTDPTTDLAVLKIEAKNLPYIIFGNSDEVKIGEWVLAVGNPFNLTSTVTAGIVSAKARNINILVNPDGTAIESFIQTDAAVNRGNSGGALVNLQGELIGINAAIASGTGYYTGYSFAIPVNIVKKVVDDFQRFGTIQRAFIGVSIREIDGRFAREEGLSEVRGVYVAGVSENGAAKAAGIREGDIILSVNTMHVNSTSELLEIIGVHRPGDEVELLVRRGDKDKVMPVVLRNSEGQTAVVQKQERQVLSILGASFEPVSSELKAQLGITNGVQVTKLGKGVLNDAGVRDGFIITKIDNNLVNTNSDVENLLKEKKGGVLVEGIYPNRMKAYYGFGM